MIENAIYSRLSGFAGLSALVNARIYPLHLPQKPSYPCVAYRRVSSKPISLLAADTDIMESTFDIASFSKEEDESFIVAEQIRLALQRWSGTEATVVVMDCMLLNIDQNYEPDLEIYESELSFMVTYRV